MNRYCIVVLPCTFPFRTRPQIDPRDSPNHRVPRSNSSSLLTGPSEPTALMTHHDYPSLSLRHLAPPPTAKHLFSVSVSYRTVDVEGLKHLPPSQLLSTDQPHRATSMSRSGVAHHNSTRLSPDPLPPLAGVAWAHHGPLISRGAVLLRNSKLSVSVRVIRTRDADPESLTARAVPRLWTALDVVSK